MYSMCLSAGESWIGYAWVCHFNFLRTVSTCPKRKRQNRVEVDYFHVFTESNMEEVEGVVGASCC